MSPFLVIGNLKMHLLTHTEVNEYLSQLRRESVGKTFAHSRGIIAPPAIHLHAFSHLPAGFTLAAQTMGWELKGAFTGEISPAMLRDAGVGHVILGHSERRAYAGETDALVAKKTRLALKEGIIPIVCLGETAEERQREQTTTVIERTVRTVFDDLSPLLAQRVIIAYEPRWAIGTGVTPTTADILQVKVYLRKLFSGLYDPAFAERMTVIYGGSVKATALASVSWEAEMSGVLVGGESLYPRELVKMLLEAEHTFSHPVSQTL
ncbi:MAG: triose-phosphate isomerase [Candidatus Moraniibacteriota bacterium]|nr:MAG: triose-phosphate isomerase [Candidatus Moranbacteria bacterium]